MKLLRYGAVGQEKPGVLDAHGQVRDLSAMMADVGGAALLPDSLARLCQIDLQSLPLVAGVLTRRALRNRGGEAAVGAFVQRLKPWSVVGLIATVVLLFGFQAQTIVAQPAVIGLIAIPLLIQTYGIFAIGYLGARWLKLPHEIAAPACLIGTSNFFELAVAVAISLFGLQSGAALATVVGVLVEVPVMLSLVALINAWAPKAADAAHH